MKDKKAGKKRILTIVLAVVLLAAIIVSAIYINENNTAKKIYFERYDQCKAAQNGSINYGGSVKSVEELQQVVDCFENKGCSAPCTSPCDPDYPGINFTQAFNKPKCTDTCVRRCLYSPDYFNNQGK